MYEKLLIFLPKKENKLKLYNEFYKKELYINSDFIFRNYSKDKY